MSEPNKTAVATKKYQNFWKRDTWPTEYIYINFKIKIFCKLRQIKNRDNNNNSAKFGLNLNCQQFTIKKETHLKTTLNINNMTWYTIIQS